MMSPQQSLDRSQGRDYSRVRATGRVVATMSWVRGVEERKTLEGSISSRQMIYYSCVVLMQGLRWGSPPSRTQVQHWWGAEWRRWKNDGGRAFYDCYPICLRPSACEGTCGVNSLRQEGEQPNWGKEVRRGVMLPEQGWEGVRRAFAELAMIAFLPRT